MYRRLGSMVLQRLHRRPLAAAAAEETGLAGRASTSAALHTHSRWASAVQPAGAAPKTTLGQQERFEQLIEDEARRRHPAALGTASGRKRRSVTASIRAQDRSPQVVSIAIAESLNLYDIQSDATVRNLYTATFIDDESDHAIHLTKRAEYAIDKTKISEAFVFSDGVVVFWNVDSTTRAQLLRDLERHAEGAYESVTAHSELDTIGFTISDGEGSSSKMDGDRFVLDGRLHADLRHRSHDSVLERFAFSHAFAASVKLGVWEALLNSLAEPLAGSTRKLKEGVIPWSRKDALRKCGEFAELRHSINLNCLLLNRDIYWDRPHLEQFYKQGSRYLTIPRRMQLLNSRLDYCEETVRMVDGMLTVRHSNLLEWMIIWLIVFEVLFETFHFYKSFEPQQVVVVQPAVEQQLQPVLPHDDRED